MLAANSTAIIVPVLLILVLSTGNYPLAIGSIFQFNVSHSFAISLCALTLLLVPGLSRYLAKRMDYIRSASKI